MRKEGEERKILKGEARAEVKALSPKGRQQILQAFEDAYERRGLELSEIERQVLADAVEVSRKPRPLKDIEGLRLLGRFGKVMVSETRRILRNEKAIDPDEEHYNKVLDRARVLGDAGREDKDAVNELRDLAGAGGTELLDGAAQWFASDGSRMDEYDNWDRSYRLLRAAASNGTVEPVPADRAEFLQEVWSLEGSPPELGWAEFGRISALIG